MSKKATPSEDDMPFKTRAKSKRSEKNSVIDTGSLEYRSKLINEAIKLAESYHDTRNAREALLKIDNLDRLTAEMVITITQLQKEENSLLKKLGKLGQL